MNEKIRNIAVDVAVSLLIFVMLAIICILGSGRAAEFTYVAF